MTWATFCIVFLLFNLLTSSQARRDAAGWSENVPIREDVSVGSTVYSIIHGTRNVVHVWLIRNQSRTVDPTDTGTYWSPLIGPDPLAGQNVNNWYIALDLAAPRTLNSIAVNKYGDTTNYIAAFTLQKSQVGSPYDWEDVTSVDNVPEGTAQRQEYDGFQGTARYWRFLVTRTHSGYQPYLTELNLYGIESCQMGDGSSYRGPVNVTETGKMCQCWDSQTPHPHDRTADNYPSSGLEENYCRNPDGDPGVWCYTTDPDKRFELCDVPVCDMMLYTVKHRRDFVNASTDFMEEENGTSIWSLNITRGNDFGRFEVVAENLSVIITAPLDYEFYSRQYNLSLELTNTADNSVWQVHLAILVMDVTGYPPYYNKRCETSVIPDDGMTENYVVMTSTNGQYELNGVNSGQYPDFFPWLRDEPVDAIMGDCSLRLCAALTDATALLEVFFLPALKLNRDRIELQCRDRELRNKGELVLMSDKTYFTLPVWAQSGRCFMADSARYVVLFEGNEIWSTSPYRIQCGANIAFEENEVSVEFMFQLDIIGCPEGRYGLYCDKDCVCKNGARCHGFNGACECRPGWRGRACDIPWPEVVIVAYPGDSVVKYIGTNLTLACLAPHIHVANMTWIYKAENDYNDTNVVNLLDDIKEKGVVQNKSINFKPILESANGEYICVVQGIDGEVVNATFVLNATTCPPNYYGEVCNQKCDCQYGVTCDRWEGCLCPPGRHGDRCEHTCTPGSFGLNCSRNCNCQNNASCDPVNGTCFCAEGQSGEFCEDAPMPENKQVVVIMLASVIPALVILVGCIVIVTLVRRRGLETKYTEGDTELDTLSSWEIDKVDITFEHMIGQGEFGHVVRGRLRVPAGYQVLVAAKSLRPDRMTASAARDFRREMDILARIHEDKEGHPNVVKFYGVLTKSEPQYIVVEYATNEELRRYLWSLREEYKVTGQRRLLERLGFASGVASGLSELARLKIVHRDIAARNVVISDRKVAKIADFGLSRDVYMSSGYERTNQGGEEELLPLKWMVMESLRDGVYTCESDVWSYGVLLWEIASFGEEPRYAGGPMHPDVCIMLELLRKGVRLQQPENCPLSVYRIIRSCWIVDPSKRPTPEDLLQKIDQLMPRRDAAHLVNHNI